MVSRCVNVCYLCWILVYGRKRCLLYIVLNIDMNLMDRKYYDFFIISRNFWLSIFVYIFYL